MIGTESLDILSCKSGAVEQQGSDRSYRVE